MRKTSRVRWIGIAAVGLVLQVSFVTFGQWPLPSLQTVSDVVTLISDIAPLTVTSIAGKTPAKTTGTAPTVSFSVIQLELDGFDRDGPPKVTVLDNVTDEVIFETGFKAIESTVNQTPSKMSFPIQLAYDTDPWSNPGKEPKAILSRIEISNAHGTQTFYVKLKAGIFVVPILWHNVLEPGDQNPMDTIKAGVWLDAAFDLFMTAPQNPDYSNQIYWDTSTASDVNTIWGRAGIQFHLINATLPYGVGQIENIVYPKKGESSSADILCNVGWSPATKFNSPDAVDIYCVGSLVDSSGTSIAGVGNCFSNGSVYIRDGAFSGRSSSGARAALVAHEFGHFLGGLTHLASADRLMHKDALGWELTSSEISKVRQVIKNRGSYFEGY